MTNSLGEQLIQAAAAKDFARAGTLLAADIEFRALTPKKLLEANGKEQVLKILDDWYSPVDAIESLDSDTIVDRPGMRYRIRWSSEQEGTFIFEQQAYYDVSDDRISRIHLVCSGDRQLDTET